MSFWASIVFLLSKQKIIYCSFVQFPNRDKNIPDKSQDRNSKLLSWPFQNGIMDWQNLYCLSATCMLGSALLDRLSASSAGQGSFENSSPCLLGADASSQSWGWAEVLGFLWCLSQCDICLQVHKLMMLKCPSSHFDPKKRDKEWKWKAGRTDREEKISDAEKKVGKKVQMVIQRVKQKDIKNLRKRDLQRNFSSGYFYRFIVSLVFLWKSSVSFHSMCMRPLSPHEFLNSLTSLNQIL